MTNPATTFGTDHAQATTFGNVLVDQLDSATKDALLSSLLCDAIVGGRFAEDEVEAFQGALDALTEDAPE